jgi:hypothetical protein
MLTAYVHMYKGKSSKITYKDAMIGRMTSWIPSIGRHSSQPFCLLGHYNGSHARNDYTGGRIQGSRSGRFPQVWLIHINAPGADVTRRIRSTFLHASTAVLLGNGDTK